LVGPNRRGQNHASSLFLGLIGGHQLLIQSSTVGQSEFFKTHFLARLNNPLYHMGYCKPSPHPYIAVGKNFFVGVPVFERVVHGLGISRVTLSIFGIKMPIDDAMNLWKVAKGFLAENSTVDIDFGFECPCPSGIPLFHSRFWLKKGSNSGTTRMFDTLGRGLVHGHHGDFGTVRYQIPESANSITFYPKVVHLLKGESDFSAAYLPTTGQGMRNRLDNIRLTATRMKAELMANPGRWNSARVEVAIRGAPSFNRAWDLAGDILVKQIPTIDCKVVDQVQLHLMLDEVISTPAFVGDDHQALLVDDKRFIARLQNKIGFWFSYWNKLLPTFAGVQDSILQHNTHDGFVVPAPIAPPALSDEDWIVDTYIYEVAPRPGSMHSVRYTYMAINDKNSRVSKKTQHATPRDAIDAMMENASKRGLPWQSYARAKKAALQVSVPEDTDESFQSPSPVPAPVIKTKRPEASTRVLRPRK
jgi:hypothetical protein